VWRENEVAYPSERDRDTLRSDLVRVCGAWIGAAGRVGWNDGVKDANTSCWTTLMEVVVQQQQAERMSVTSSSQHSYQDGVSAGWP
jgi:hypothetical protein